MPRAFIHRSVFFVIIFFFIFLPDKGSCQQLVYKFKQFTTNEGLPSSEVHQVLRDSRNFMWFATDHGVCRYDGYKFETFNLPDNSILSMYEDVKKRIWIVSFSGQLFYYENGKFHDYKYNDLVVRMINQAAINRVYVDSLDNVYISTIVPNCFVVSPNGKVQQLYQYNLNWMFEAFETSGGKYFTYSSGSPVTIYSKAPDVYSSFFSNVQTIITVKSKNKIYKFQTPGSIHGRKCGAINLHDTSVVFFSGDLLVKASINGIRELKKFDNNILDVKELGNKNLLVATIQNGMYVLNNKNEIIENYFPGLTVSSIEKDYEGGLWVSTTQAGAFYLNSTQIKHFSDNNGIIDKKMLCLEVVNKSTILAGEESGGLLYFEIGGDAQYFNLPVVSVNGIHVREIPKTIFVCAGTFINKGTDKILIYRKHDIDFTLFCGISDIIDSKSGILTGSPTGIIKLDLKRKTTEFVNDSNFRVAELFQDHNKNILIGNLFGLWQFVNGELKPYDSSMSIFRSRITDINEYKNSYLLLGTRGKGFLIALNDSLHCLTTADGLASDNIRKIFVDEDVIWLATNKGLSRLTIKSLNPFKYTITNISVQDGLLSNEINDIKRLDSNIIVASNGGISLFDRSLFSGDKQIPLPIYVTGIKINGIDTAINEQYSFNYKYRNLSLSFVALSYTKSSNIEYRYRLMGIDSNWVDISSREIQLNPIQYGHYAVQIQARRLGEDWTEKNNLSISITRYLPFWKTTWFLMMCFLLAAFIMMLFFISRTRKIKQRERERTFLNKKLAEMELKALRAQMNPHFIFNVLNSIQYYIVHNENEEAQHYMSKFAKLVRLTLDNSRSTFISLSDEISLLRLYIDLEKIRFDDRFEYQIRVDDNIDLNAVKIPNMLLQPYVENSIKHGFKEKGIKYFLDISIFKETRNIVCSIQDNGIGREKAKLIPGTEKDKHSSTGTIIIKEKIEALKLYYKYDLSSETSDMKDDNGNAIGTKVVLAFPEKFDISDVI